MKKTPAVAGLLLLAATVGQAVTVIDLVPGDVKSIAYGINDSDQVVLSSGGQAFLWDGGVLLPMPGNVSSPANINNEGTIACGVVSSVDGIMYAGEFDLYGSHSNGIRILGSLGGVIGGVISGATAAVNSWGRACGTAFAPGGMPHAVMYDPVRGFVDLGNLGNNATAALDVNEIGEVVGQTLDGNGFLYHGQTMFAIAPFGSTRSAVTAINNQTAMAGYYAPANGGPGRAFMLDTVYRDIHEDSVASDINDANQVVGDSFVRPCRACPTEAHAFIYTNDRYIDLNDELGPGAQWLLAHANAINEQGHVVGYGYLKGQIHAFLMVR